MSSPICDFVNDYAKSGTVRFHMPGHKGVKLHGLEALDITEIKGADYLFEAEGIILRSEEQTAKAFGTAKTLYSTEGSSLCIKTMLGIIMQTRKKREDRMLVCAPRNVHKAFINGCILLDIDVEWIYPSAGCTSICSGAVTADDVLTAIESCERLPDCVYITSPDYLGKLCDIKEISEVCHSRGIPLVCDNAHGAYLNFLGENLHPIALGADMCCDSAHKTLPCYTGGAYLHISKAAPEEFIGCAKEVMSLFASTSPSYLILQSLDLCSDYISKDFRAELAAAEKRVELCKKRLIGQGWQLYGDEPMKITICANESGLDGVELADRLRGYNIEPEYSDCRFVVLMISVFNSEEDLAALENAMGRIPQPRIRIINEPDEIPRGIKRMNIRQAAFSPSHKVDVEQAEGKICAMTVTSCQPSVPVVISGEEITSQHIKILKRYSICEINVL